MEVEKRRHPGQIEDYYGKGTSLPDKRDFNFHGKKSSSRPIA